MPIRNGYHSRGYLPHIKVAEGAYFVTFRLVDSLPRETMLRLMERRNDLLCQMALKKTDEMNFADHERFASYATEVDAVLDQHTGQSHLRNPAIAGLVSRALQHFAGTRYSLHAWCVMPNHVHVVVRPQGGHALDSILHSRKSYTGHEANRVLERTGEFWQRESYDHWIRDGDDLRHCCEYTEQNPVKAGLCSTASDWSWSSAARP